MKARLPSLTICFLLGAITLALYWPVGHFEFTGFDDPAYVYENVHVQRGLNFETVAWAFQSFESANWHPLTWLSHALDVQWFGLDAGKHHLVNVLFHALNVILVFLVFKKLTGAFWRSAFIAALFAWHPLRVESVAWVAERKDVLSAFFGLLATGAYVEFTNCDLRFTNGKTASRRKLISYLLALIFFALALLSKPMLVTLPFIFLLLDFWPLQRVTGGKWQVTRQAVLRLVIEKIPFFALSVLSSVLTFLAQRQGGAVSTVDDLSAMRRLINATLGYFGYLEKLFWPSPLAVFYAIPESTPRLRLAIAILTLGLITVVAIKLRHRRPYLLWGWLWFLGSLVPVIGVVQVGSQLMADRYTYIPLLGLTAGLVWLVCDIKSLKPGMLAAVAALICLALTHRQLPYWRNGIVLFEHAIAVTSKNYVAENHLAFAFAKAGRLQEAEAARRRAVALRPSWAMYSNLAGDLTLENKIAEALPFYEKAAQLNPKEPEILKNWGLTLLKAGYTNEAMEKFTLFVNAHPSDAEAYLNLGYGLTKLGRDQEAVEAFNKAIALRKDYPDPHLHLGFIYSQHGNIPEAVAHYETAVKLNPFYTEAHNNLANIQLQQGKIDEALQHSLAALKSKPNFEPAHINAADAYLAKGDIAGVIRHWRAAVRLHPDWPPLCNNLAWLLATNPDPSLRNGKEAVELAERACKLSQPPSSDLLATLAAAYAEAGRFEDAIKTSEQAMVAARAAGQTELVKKLEARSQLFRSHQPFHE